MSQIDPAPLVEAIDRRGGLIGILRMGDQASYEDGRRVTNGMRAEEWNRYKSLARQLARMRAGSRIKVSTADEWCIRLLGLNPALVFGAAWWESVDEPDEVAQAWLEGAA